MTTNTHYEAPLMKRLLLFLTAVVVSKFSFAGDSEAELEQFRMLVDPVIYSSTYRVPNGLDYIKQVESKEVPGEFKERMRFVKNEMLKDLFRIKPQLCREDSETSETDCLSPLRGAEYHLVYDRGNIQGFIFVGYAVEINESSLGVKDTWAYRYVVHKNGRIVQNGFFDLDKENGLDDGHL